MRNEPLLDLEKILSFSTVHIYWVDLNNVYQGCNTVRAIAMGLQTRFDVVGKRNKDLPWSKTNITTLKNWDKINVEVMSTGIPKVLEESAKLLNGSEVVFLSHKIPLRDKNRNIVGLLGISLDITDQKIEITQLKKEKEEAKFTLDYILAHLPSHVYWKDNNGVYLGSNDQQAKSLGLYNGQEIVGKTDLELPWKRDDALKFIENDMEVIRTGITKTVEESAIFNGRPSIVLSQKVPLKNKGDDIIGVLGISVDITAQKEAEKLKLENARKQVDWSQKQAEKIREITAQVAHDINSPLASLRMLMHNLQDVDEDTRIAIRNATNRITDIANNLVIKYGSTGEVEKAKANVLTPELISSLVSNILSEQRVQHRENIVFELHISDEVEGIFASVSHEHCKRMISNIINNAVEAIDKAKRKLGVVDVSIDKEEDYIVICIKDNGCGVSASILKKLGKEQVSSKGDLGHGIGLFTAIEHLRAWGGDYDIVTKKNAGTTFTIKLPITIAPSWFQKELSILTGSTIVILDDDESIHDVWNTRFRKYRNQVKIKHFSKAELMLKERFPQGTVFLIDYELFDTINGLEVIRRLQSRSMYLVTSRYEDEKIKSGCMELGVKIIPKNFAPYIPIDIYEIKDKGPDYIFIDDDVNLLRAWKIDASMNDKELEAFSSIEAFEEKKARYSKDTPIYIDYVLGVDDGVKYSKQLAKEGFNNLYLATGHDKSNFTEPMPWLRGIVGKEPPELISNYKEHNKSGKINYNS